MNAKKKIRISLILKTYKQSIFDLLITPILQLLVFIPHTLFVIYALILVAIGKNNYIKKDVE